MVARGRYSIAELAQRAGVSRRTVRFYVQRGLIPAPYGRGRGRHYGHEHFEAVLRIQALKAEGHTLADLCARREAPPGPSPKSGRAREVAGKRARRTAGKPPPGRVWVRQTVAPGYELHVAADKPPLREEQLARLARLLGDLGDDDEQVADPRQRGPAC